MDSTQADHAVKFPVLILEYRTSIDRAFFYPKDEVGQTIVKLMRRQCFTKSQVETLKSVGFDVQINFASEFREGHRPCI